MIVLQWRGSEFQLICSAKLPLRDNSSFPVEDILGLNTPPDAIMGVANMPRLSVITRNQDTDSICSYQ